ncbi:flagellar biosynthesis protein FlhF [Sporosarcina sp. ACRSL]|uniref:flagellar biosynthesis protein FlhF n=1 Tax=Sporosarcina sp. ACRSL TaxID=2918215 RepID=UPI001EF6BB60|nr:flagellar biosynthesis protein FlhF [Sporosarcina sp. ACRSL]MCG7342886.1 flagellar biosynthesis protein FlhF [Sporosarcina sp. ACRSL]
MKMKKYTADTMVEAMKKVRADLGDDAVILSSNVVTTKGFLGFFQKKSVEVVAGFDEPASFQKESVLSSKPAPTMEEVRNDDAELRKEMVEMKRLLQEMKQSSIFENFPDDLKVFLTYLADQELSQHLILQIGNEIFTKMKEEKKDFSRAEQLQIAKNVLAEQFSELPFGGISFSKKYINVLGPTGVGKTTTIAKIAARALLEHKKKIGFITTDTYRIAAIEQLRTYANLLQAPVEIAYNSKDFEEAIAKMADRDLIFIDTAGRNYKEMKFVNDLKHLIDFSLDMESFLVLSVTSKEDDMRTIIEKFTSFPIEKFIFTKVDETGSIGPMFNLMKQYSIGTAYYTDGQEVPEDIVEVDIDKMLKLLLAGAEHA